MGSSRLGKTNPKERAAPVHSATLSYYAGTRRLPNLSDGREVWQAFVGGLWRTYYELPLDGTGLARIHGRLALTGKV
jgi:hypothetical protein